MDRSTILTALGTITLICEFYDGNNPDHYDNSDPVHVEHYGIARFNQIGPDQIRWIQDGVLPVESVHQEKSQ